MTVAWPQRLIMCECVRAHLCRLAWGRVVQGATRHLPPLRHCWHADPPSQCAVIPRVSPSVSTHTCSTYTTHVCDRLQAHSTTHCGTNDLTRDAPGTTHSQWAHAYNAPGKDA